MSGRSRRAPNLSIAATAFLLDWRVLFRQHDRHMPHPCGQRHLSAVARAMDDALDAAAEAARRGEVPVGAVVLGPDGDVLARAANAVEERGDPTAHAEMLAMRAAMTRRHGRRLFDCTLVVTLEPCPMCAAASVHCRVGRVVFGAYDPKGGGVEHGPRVYAAPGCLHRPEVVGGVRESDSAALLRAFFTALR